MTIKTKTLKYHSDMMVASKGHTNLVCDNHFQIMAITVPRSLTWWFPGLSQVLCTVLVTKQEDPLVKGSKKGRDQGIRK